MALPASGNRWFTWKAGAAYAAQTRGNGRGKMGRYYQRSDADMMAIWQVAVAETRDLLEGDWS